jgi:hypothetical protein
MDAGDHGVTDLSEDRPWLDVLNRKHECGPALSRYRTLDLTQEGRPLRIRIPDNLADPDRLEVRGTVRSDSLLVLIGHHTMKGEDAYERGILMVARAEAEGAFVVHVWHELDPWALKSLGLGEVSESS